MDFQVFLNSVSILLLVTKRIEVAQYRISYAIVTKSQHFRALTHLKADFSSFKFKAG